MGPRLTSKKEGFAEVNIGFADLYRFLDLTVVPISVPSNTLRFIRGCLDPRPSPWPDTR